MYYGYIDVVIRVCCIMFIKTNISIQIIIRLFEFETLLMYSY